MGTAEGHTDLGKERDTRREKWRERRKERGREVRKKGEMGAED